jgi:hypothetical protein
MAGGDRRIGLPPILDARDLIAAILESCRKIKTEQTNTVLTANCSNPSNHSQVQKFTSYTKEQA